MLIRQVLRVCSRPASVRTYARVYHGGMRPQPKDDIPSGMSTYGGSLFDSCRVVVF
jgi:hypothetical protein